MAGQKDKAKFVFFKYVPPKQAAKPLKTETYTKSEILSETPEATDSAEWFGPPPMPGNPGSPGCLTDVGMPEFPCNPEPPGCQEPIPPGMPCYPEPPECPELPEMPDYTEPPEFPELPDYTEPPIYPGPPVYPEPPICPEPPEPLPEPEPEPEPEGPCPENSVMHQIQPGDTYWKLAKRYGTTVDAIAMANPDLDPLNLTIGEEICIPLGIPGAKG